MACRRLLGALHAHAAGQEASSRLRVHLDDCATCRDALARRRRALALVDKELRGVLAQKPNSVWSAGVERTLIDDWKQGRRTISQRTWYWTAVTASALLVVLLWIFHGIGEPELSRTPSSHGLASSAGGFPSASTERTGADDRSEREADSTPLPVRATSHPELVRVEVTRDVTNSASPATRLTSFRTASPSAEPTGVPAVDARRSFEQLVGAMRRGEIAFDSTPGPGVRTPLGVASESLPSIPEIEIAPLAVAPVHNRYRLPDSASGNRRTS